MVVVVSILNVGVDSKILLNKFWVMTDILLAREQDFSLVFLEVILLTQTLPSMIEQPWGVCMRLMTDFILLWLNRLGGNISLKNHSKSRQLILSIKPQVVSMSLLMKLNFVPQYLSSIRSKCTISFKLIPPSTTTSHYFYYFLLKSSNLLAGNFFDSSPITDKVTCLLTPFSISSVKIDSIKLQ